VLTWLSHQFGTKLSIHFLVSHYNNFCVLFHYIDYCENTNHVNLSLHYHKVNLVFTFLKFQTQIYNVLWLGAAIYYIIIFRPLSDPYPIKLAASYLLETPLAIKLITKLTPYPHHDIIFSLTHPPIITDNVIYGQPPILIILFKHLTLYIIFSLITLFRSNIVTTSVIMYKWLL